MRKIFIILTAGILLSVSACGYFLYPERVGQKNGKLDPAIIVLDSAALLFGIVPGVVAFAVDITTGAIYLSPGQKSVLEKHRQTQLMIDGENLRPADEEEIIIDRAQTARRISNILGYPVDAEKIQYFKPLKAEAAVAAIPAGNLG